MKSEISYIVITLAAFLHVLIGVVILTLILEDSMSTWLDVLMSLSWVPVLLILSVASHKVSDKEKKERMYYFNKQIKKK